MKGIQECSSSSLLAGWLILPPAPLTMAQVRPGQGAWHGTENDFIAALFPKQSGQPLLLLNFLHTSQPHKPQSVV